ncbi:MAG: hypothetical protein K0M45_09300 [Candidatus Paracaedibacteraceae bacterium]|nr:hypothetical protein [Candidatus Paracaedibacteraceae bacterium]
MKLYRSIILSLCLSAISPSFAVTYRASHSDIEKVEFNKLPVDTQQLGAEYAPQQDFLHLLVINKELSSIIQDVRFRRVWPYFLKEPIIGDYTQSLKTYLEEAKLKDQTVSLRLTGISSHLKTLTSELENYSNLLKYLNINCAHADKVPFLENLEFLATASHLETLELNDINIRNLSSLANSIHLTKLNLSSAGVEDISPLATLLNLTNLDLSYTDVSDISPLAKLNYLTTLKLNQTKVKDISSLATLPNLAYLNLYQTNVTDTGL